MLYNTSGKTSKHPVVFEKAPVLFLKAAEFNLQMQQNSD